MNKDKKLRIRQVNAARYLVKINPNKYYLKYYVNQLQLWERDGGLVDWLVCVI